MRRLGLLLLLPLYVVAAILIGAGEELLKMFPEWYRAWCNAKNYTSPEKKGTTHE